MLVAIVILSILTVFLLYASYEVSSGVYLKTICCNHAVKDAFAITFDDGVDETVTPIILDILKKYDAKATFFIIGEKAKKFPHIVKRIADEGHQVGNHSCTHKWSFPLKSASAIYEDIMLCNSTLEEITGVKTTLFRPPFGVTNPMVGRGVRRSGATAVGWSIRSFDTLGEHPDKVIKRIAKRIGNGEILLLHDNLTQSPIILEKVLQILKSKSLKAVTIDDFLIK